VEEDSGQADAVLTYAADSLRAFSTLFGPYPYPELDVAQAPLVGGAGGVEYPGLITVAMALTAQPSGDDPLAGLMAAFLKSTQSLEFVLAHEVAHQWWHALVGSDSNRHPFLDEALANYSAVLYFEKKHGQKAAAQQLQLELAMPYQLYRMMGGPDGRVDRPVKEFSSQLEYAALVYGKGALFFNALRKLVGKKVFLRLLKKYARLHAFRQATPDDLFRVAVAATKKKARVKALIKRWIEENHGDEDIGTLDMSAMDQLINQLSSMQAGGNVRFDGPIDPAILNLFQQAVQQLSGP
jgi:aminopeptidase N